MKKRLVYILLLCFIFIFVGQIHATKRTNQKIKKPEIKTESTTDEVFNYYKGKRNVYKITINDDKLKTKAFFYRKIYWPTKNGGVDITPKYIDFSHLQFRKEGFKNLKLVKTVVRKTSVEIPYHFPIAFEIKIERDDAKIYRYTKSIFEVFDYDKKEIYEIIFWKSGSALDPRPADDQKTLGFSVHLVFYVESSLFKPLLNWFDLKERLSFLAKIVLKKKPQYFLRRSVKGNKNINLYPYNQEFEELLFYEKNTGLVLLEQKINGKTSMLWKIER